MKAAILTIAHGTVTDLADLPAFLANIRRGHAAPPDLVAEVTRRYQAIGGKSPLLDICRSLTAKLEAKTGVPCRMAMRLWEPYPKDVLAELADDGITRVAVVPLAQHSAKIYGEVVRAAADEIAQGGGTRLDVACAADWGQEPGLTRAFAAAVRAALGEVPKDARAKTTLVLTAHSLPVAVVQAGDPYETHVRKSAADVVSALGAEAPHHTVAFQSQGMGTGPGGRPMPWLGPGLKEAIVAAAARGDTHVVVAPIGFLADHVEILYDLDIEAQAWAKEAGVTLVRTRSLNDGDALVDVLANVAAPLLG
jgi:ferrochelatase